MIQLTCQEVREKGADFGTKLSQALRSGFFYMEIPATCKDKISAVAKFAENIRKNEELKTAQLGDRLGYQIREGTQAVAFSAMCHQWEQVFPSYVIEVAWEMKALAIEIFKTALSQLSVPEEKWSLLTGKATDGEGINVFTLNDYQPGIEQIGLIPHKDMGGITILFNDSMGLQTSQDGKKWTEVPPKEGFFIINFGRAFEILINDKDKLDASLHRVQRLAEKRMSFGIFINPKAGSDMYQMNENGQPVVIGNYQDYLDKCFSEFKALQEQLK